MHEQEGLSTEAALNHESRAHEVAVQFSGGAAGLPASAMPLTERVLPRSGWRRLAATLVWAAVPVLRELAFYTGRRLPGLDRMIQPLGQSVVLSGVILLALWGSARLAREFVAIEPAVARLVQGDPLENNARPIRGVGSLAGPLVLTFAFTLVLELTPARMGGWGLALLELPLNFAMSLPMMTVFWVYLVLLIGLNRLGQSRLSLHPFPEDRTLGLHPIGALAFLGFWIITLGTVPILLLITRTLVDLIPVLAILLSGLAVFFLSLYRIHRQMVAAKKRYVEWVRGLYAEAYQRVRQEGSLEALQAQAPLLSGVEALERRAEAIYPWPFEASIPGRMAAIITSVMAAIIARLILSRLGL